jgi:hypothetical protein
MAVPLMMLRVAVVHPLANISAAAAAEKAGVRISCSECLIPIDTG